MIAEPFEESPVLLGALLKLELEELAYVRFSSRSTQDVDPLDDITRAKIRAWNGLDVLQSSVGLERLNRQAALLRGQEGGGPLGSGGPSKTVAD